MLVTNVKHYFPSITFAVLFAWSTAVVHASPLISVGENVDVFFNGSSSLRWQSNVFYEDEQEEEDLLLVISPGLEVNVGRGLSNLDLSLITRYDIMRYDDLSHLDDEYFHIKAIGAYKSGRWDLNGLVSFDEEQSTSGQEGGFRNRGEIVESDNLRATFGGEYSLSPKFSVGLDLRYDDKDYINNDELSDCESFTVPIDIFYELTPKVDLSVGYEYRTEEIGKIEIGDTTNGLFADSYDKETHYFNVGARGNLLAKLTGHFKVGYRMTDPDNSRIVRVQSGSTAFSEVKRDSQDTLGLDANLTHLTTPKLTTFLRLHRGFDVGGQGQSTTNTSANLSASYALNDRFSASSFFGYTLREYEESDDDDNLYRAGVRLSYVPNRYWSFSTGYNYIENDSDRNRQDYENHTIDLSASLRY